MTKDELEEIEDLKYHIRKVEPIVKADQELLKKGDSFPVRFMATWNAWTLEHKKEELNDLLSKQENERIRAYVEAHPEEAKQKREELIEMVKKLWTKKEEENK